MAREGPQTKPALRISGEERRAAIVRAARNVFVEKGFHATTTRELAKAAGVSEALLFKHFPSKEALYVAIQRSCFKEEGSKIIERLESLEPSTSALVSLVYEFVSHVVGRRRDEADRTFLRLVFRSLMDGGEFTRLAIQGGPSHWVQKVEACVQAARAAGDMADGPVEAKSGAWFAHHVVSGIMVHSLPAEPVIDYGASQPALVRQVVWFCLRGLGLKEEAIRRHYPSEGTRTK
jgi:AcrR family transcriptional regulator